MPSSVVSTFRYDPASATLRIIFVTGMIYDYLNVPEKIYEALRNATSKGRYLNQNIKGHYEFKKIK